MFVEKKYETLIDLRFPVGQWQLRLFKAITNQPGPNPTPRQESKYGRMFVAFDDTVFLWDGFAYVRDGMEGIQEWVILAAIIGTGCGVIDPDYR